MGTNACFKCQSINNIYINSLLSSRSKFIANKC